MNAHSRSALQEAGATAIPLVLLPGTLCDAALFAPVLDRVAVRDTQVVPIRRSDPQAAADAILADAPPRFALLGFSLGGIVALEVALRAPDRVIGLALLDSNARARPADMPGTSGSAAERVETAWPRYVAPARLRDASLRAVVDAMAERTGPATLALQDRVAATRSDKRDRLAAITGPALILAGAQDAICPPAFQHELAAGLPDAELVLLDGVGHFAPLEAPDAVASHVSAWLARVDRAAAAVSSSPTHQEHP